MKCQKCGYVSFDDNRVCPKCGKDLDAEREKMNLASYRPAPISASDLLTDGPEELEAFAFPGGTEAFGAWGQILDTGSPEEPSIVGDTESTLMHEGDIEIHLEPQSEGKQEKSRESISESETPSQDGFEDLLLTLEDLGVEDSETLQGQSEQAIEYETGLEPHKIKPVEKEKDSNSLLDLEALELDLDLEKPENKSS